MCNSRITMGIINIFFSIKFTYILFLVLDLVCISECLFEDQVGKFDWRHSFTGKLKYSYFGSATNAHEIIIATEENVLAALRYKTGDISWRNVLENGSRGNITFLHVDKEIVTITGEYPFIVRGWDIRTGSSLWEWTLYLLRNKEQATLSQSWFAKEDNLYHILPINGLHIELTRYGIRTGSNEHSTTRIPASWINDRCLLTSSFYICPVNDLIIGIDLSRSDVQTFKIRLGSQFDGTIQTLKGSIPSIFVNGKLYLIKDGAFKEVPITFHEHSSSITLLLNNKELILESYIDNKLHYVIGHHDQNDQVNIGLPIDYPENFTNPTIKDAFCMHKGQRIICSTLYCAEDNMLFLRVQDKIIWQREESLCDISAVRMIDLPLTEDGLQGALKKTGDSLEMFGRRLFIQATHLKYFLMSLFGSDLSRFRKQDLVRDSFGLHKMIVIVTSIGKIFGIDNIDATVHWSRYIPELAKNSDKFHIELLEQRTTKYYPHDAQCTIIGNNLHTKKGFMFQFNPITGRDINDGIMNLPFTIRQHVLTPENEDNLKGILILDDENIPHVYPSSSQQLAVGTYMYTINKLTGIAEGFLIEHMKGSISALPIWSMKLTISDHTVTHVATKNLFERVNSQGRVLADRSVLYKYLNPNLVAVATQGPDPVHKYIMSIILLDVVSGKIVFSTTHIRAKEPVQIVLSENWLVYSYFNDKSRRTEIGTMEMYEGKLEPNTTTWSSFRASQPMIEKQTYIFPAQVDALRETITIRGITAKHILIGTSFGSILEMPWIFLDPRRPIAITGEVRDESILPYVPELPMPSEGIINYNQSVERIKDIVAMPSGLESTCLVLVHGLDIFYTRVAPSQTFDLLKEDFDYLMIMVVLSVLMVTVFITKHLANRRALRQAWN